MFQLARFAYGELVVSLADDPLGVVVVVVVVVWPASGLVDEYVDLSVVMGAVGDGAADELVMVVLGVSSPADDAGGGAGCWAGVFIMTR